MHDGMFEKIEDFIAERIEAALDLGYDDWARPRLRLVEDDERDPIPACRACQRGWHHECRGCGCECNAEEDGDG
jgi:hypothetical protein